MVDDGSTDDSARIAESYGSAVRVVRQANQGESVARNRAVDLARGQWIALLDADDVWQPRKLEIQLAAVEQATEEIVCVYSDYYEFGDGRITQTIRRPEYHALPDYRVQMLVDWSVHPSASLFPRALARRVRFPEDIRHGEDVVFFLSLRESGQFLRVPAALAGYRRRRGQQTSSPDHVLRSVAGRYAWFLKNLARYSESEQCRVRAGLAGSLADTHNRLRRRYRNRRISDFRALHSEILPDAAAATLFRKRHCPRTLLKMIERARRVFARATLNQSIP